jgi:uncharacterized membrane protein
MQHAPNEIRDNRKSRIFSLSIFLLLLIHIAGGIGMIYFDTSLFAKATPINLLAMVVLILWNQEDLNNRFYLAISTAFLIGFLSEVAGVNGGFLFGHYSYGNILGFKLIHVPVLISLNWFAVVYSSYVTASLMLRFLGYDVRNLDRVVFANLTKKNVERSKWRYLNEKEVRLLKFMNSSFIKKNKRAAR